MRILILNINLGHWGGIESYADVLCSVLLDRGHEVMISSCTDHRFFTPRSAGLPVKATKINIRNSVDVGAILKIIRLCIREKIGLIIAHHGKDYWPAVLAARISGKRIIFVRHQTVKLKKTTCWLINNWVDAVVAVSGAVRESLVSAGVSGDKIRVIHNCVSLRRFDPLAVDAREVRRELGIMEKDVVVGAVGKVHRDKGVFDLLHAAGRLAGRYPSLKVLYVGSGPARQKLEAEAQGLSMRDRIIFAGVRTDVERIYAAMDVCILPSICVEGFGMTLIEAMAMRRPVIGTAIGGIKEIVSDRVNGVLVPAGDAAALSDAIAGYIENEKFAEDIALEGRKTVESKFSDKVYGEKFEALLGTFR